MLQIIAKMKVRLIVAARIYKVAFFFLFSFVIAKVPTGWIIIVDIDV